ncbi:hypothetical protein ACIRRA_27180 [Nocardia sp. NPDC101769]|uniref:hypothetical protein n=1 Tax=Nocardia sp. NPDC101769 TaxID=3364333 RepID=UPI003805C155
MRKVLRTSAIAGVVAVCGLLGTQAASATPPVATPEPGGVIRMDPVPGEWWNCAGWSLRPPFIGSDPVTGLSEGRPLYLHFAPGADVWMFCTGASWPFSYWGPIVKAGE